MLLALIMCSRVKHLVVSCACIYYDKKGLFGVLPLEKSPVSVIYCSLVEFNGQKVGLLCQATCSGKEIRKHSINGMEKGFRKIVLM